jgi:hypothetical protein
MTEDGADTSTRVWSRKRRDVAAVLWSSFLAASVATMVLFALIDPATVGDLLPHAAWSVRMTAYSAGFFFLWLACGASAALTLYLVRTAREDRAPSSR